jgi:hypothetical protein
MQQRAVMRSPWRDIQLNRIEMAMYRTPVQKSDLKAFVGNLRTEPRAEVFDHIGINKRKRQGICRPESRNWLERDIKPRKIQVQAKEIQFSTFSQRSKRKVFSDQDEKQGERLLNTRGL